MVALHNDGGNCDDDHDIGDHAKDNSGDEDNNDDDKDEDNDNNNTNK